MKKVIKIANGQGFWGDSIEAPKRLIEGNEIDYLTLDYLAEVTMSIMQQQKLKNPKSGYATDFVDFIDSVAQKIINNNIKIITNAGGVNPIACKDALYNRISNKLSRNLKVAIILGDDIYDNILDFHNKQHVPFENMDTSKNFNLIKNKICSANVYISCFTVAEALSKGADIVLAGRITDPGLVVGPCIYEFGWGEQDFDKLAQATVAGHIVECGAQCTGGNFSHWHEVDDFAKLGYPIIKIDSDGTFNVCKEKMSSGIVNRYTVSEQILYELGNPKEYLSPDVTVDFTSFSIEEVSKNEVKVIGAKGAPPPQYLKVAISYFDGYKAHGQLTVSGPDALDKAKLVSNIIWSRLEKSGCKISDKRTEFLGVSSCFGDILSVPNQINEVVLRLGVRSYNKDKIIRFSKELAPIITSGPPGVTGFSGGRPKAKRIIGYWPSLINRNLIKTSVAVF